MVMCKAQGTKLPADPANQLNAHQLNPNCHLSPALLAFLPRQWGLFNWRALQMGHLGLTELDFR